MERRTFLKVTGMAVAGSALGAASRTEPASAAVLMTPTTGTPGLGSMLSTVRLSTLEPGAYQISGLVRLHAPQVQIMGISNTQSISWSATPDAEPPVASFTTFETVAAGEPVLEIRIVGGSLEAVWSTSVEPA
jgi:hypothetical protein